MRIIISGSRDFQDYNMFKIFLNEIFFDLSVEDRIDVNVEGQDVEIISGGATGADALAEKFAMDYQIDFLCFPAKWNDFSSPCLPKTTSYGKKYNALAGHKRNLEMADYVKNLKNDEGILVAFWDEKSRGTEDMIKIAKSKKIETYVISTKRNLVKEHYIPKDKEK